MSTLGTDRFELVRQVGEGSYGVVYEAQDRHAGGMVAIKLLHRGDELAEERFEREAQVLAELQHPAIVHYVAHGTSGDGKRYLVMEWLTGHTLERQLRGRQPVSEVLALARRVVSGLAFAELRGVTHRDIKPANLFLVDGSMAAAKILDFGLARRTADRQQLTQTGFVVGTPLYMSPEQARGDSSVDARTDIFSLGSVLYTCLCGEEPFFGAHPLATLAKICFDEPQPIERLAPHVPERLRRLVQWMLQKKREERPSLRMITEELASIAMEHSANSDTIDSASMTIDISIVKAHRGSSSLQRRVRIADQRISAALFVGEVGKLPAPLESELNAVATRSGARVERLLDGTRLVLPNQQLGAGEQTLVAARCALLLRQLLGSTARLVVCTGRAVIGELQPLGDLFERGAVLLAATVPGTVNVDEASASLLEARFELGPGRTLERERRGGEAPRTVLGQQSAFVGRERDLQQLSLFWNECVDDQVPRAVLVTAPAGGGKSRLLHEWLERLRSNGAPHTLLMARGDSMRGGAQFSVLASAVHAWAELAYSDALELKRAKLSARMRSLLPAERASVVAEFVGEMIGVPFVEPVSPALRAARLDHQLMTDHMLACWLEWLEPLSRDGPLLICVEDLHWSDLASLRFLDAALRNARERSLMVLALARPEVRELFPKLWVERDLNEIRLTKLGARVCAKLVDALTESGIEPTLRDAMIERADGNPFFLEELVRAHKSHAGELPESILAIVQARLDTLGDEPKLLVRAASVYGQSFRLAGLRALFGDEAAQADLDLEGGLALLCEREIIYLSGPASEQEYVFRHALIRDAAYLLLHDEDRALSHRLAASWLERNAEAPALLADHYERGGVPESAARWWARAAEQAFEAGSLDDVMRCGERAIGCGCEGEPLGNLAALLAEARSYDQDNAGSAAWAERARAVLAPGMPAWWRATQVAAVAYLRQGAPELDVLAAEMIAHYAPEHPLPEQTMAIAYLMEECLRVMRDELAERLLVLIPQRLPASLAGRPEGCIAAARAVKSFRARNYSEALRFTLDALGAQRRAGALRDVCASLALAGYLLHEVGAYEEAQAYLLEVVALGHRIGSKRDLSYAQMLLGSCYMRRGSFDDAERMTRDSRKGHAELGMTWFEAETLGNLAGVQLGRGELTAARETIEAALAIALEPAPHAYLLTRASSLALLSGRTDEAREKAGQARAIAHESQLYEYVGMVEACYLESLIAVGDPGLGNALAEAMRWLESEANKIDDARLRGSFLESVPEHARIRALDAAARALAS